MQSCLFHIGHTESPDGLLPSPTSNILSSQSSLTYSSLQLYIINVSMIFVSVLTYVPIQHSSLVDIMHFKTRGDIYNILNMFLCSFSIAQPETCAQTWVNEKSSNSKMYTGLMHNLKYSCITRAFPTRPFRRNCWVTDLFSISSSY